MTVAMWLAWLLRVDVRGGAPIHQSEMQREFVVWWLLWGKTAFPGSWWYGPDQLAVAMEPVEAAPGVMLPRLVRQIHRARTELRTAFPLADSEDGAELLCWYRLFGPSAFAHAPALPHGALLETERPSRRAPWNADATLVPRMAMVWQRIDPGINARGDPNSSAGRTTLASWYNRVGRGRLAPLHAAPEGPEIVLPASSRRVAVRGVNVLGYTIQPSGVGEDARMLARALKAAGIDAALVDVASAAVAAEPPAQRMPHATTVFCLSGFDTARLFLEHGPAMFAGRRNIGAWPWELPEFPTAWSDALALVDEIWAASRFTATAFAAAGAKPVHLLPPAVAVPTIRAAPRGAPPLPAPEVFTFVYPFDPNSFIARKNPRAAVEAFRLAFPPPNASVALLLRLNGAPPPTQDWSEVLDACSGDQRIVIDTETHPRERALSIIARLRLPDFPAPGGRVRTQHRGGHPARRAGAGDRLLRLRRLPAVARDSALDTTPRAARRIPVRRGPVLVGAIHRRSRRAHAADPRQRRNLRDAAAARRGLRRTACAGGRGRALRRRAACVYTRRTRDGGGAIRTGEARRRTTEEAEWRKVFERARGRSLLPAGNR